MPDFTYEKEAMQNGYRAVCGCDEAGRGPLCGPVVAAAVIMIGVFMAFVHTDNVYVKPIALGLTVGIAADAFLIPAYLSVMKKLRRDLSVTAG